MDGFSRILEKKLSELLCTRLYDGITALMYAARRYGKNKMVKLLLPKSDVKAVCCQTDDDTGGNGYTALDLAKSFGNSQIVSLLQQYN